MTTLRGSCLCEGVEFELTGPFQSVGYCHCASCKKLSGSIGTASARVAVEDIRIVNGQELLRTYQPQEGTAKTFCSVCGSNLFGGGWPERPWASVRLAAIDDPFDEKPTSHIYTRSVALWETLPDDGTERFEERP